MSRFFARYTNSAMLQSLYEGSTREHFQTSRPGTAKRSPCGELGKPKALLFPSTASSFELGAGILNGSERTNRSGGSGLSVRGCGARCGVRRSSWRMSTD